MLLWTPDSFPPPLPGKTGWPWQTEAEPLPPARPDGSPWPRISIVVPSFNQGAFLEETLRSVLLQGYPDTELIVIDGGSTDESVDVIRRYESFLAYWVSEADGGQSEAINKGFERCTGELITFLGSDDLYLPGTFADVGRRWPADESYGAVVGGFVYLDGERQGAPRPAHLPGEGPHDLSLGVEYRLHQVSTFYARHALDAVGRHVREDLVYTMDRELLYRICQRFKVRLAPATYGAFRRHTASKSVAEVLPFAREFARLQTLFLTGEVTADRVRRRQARVYWAKGYLRYARMVGGLPAARALLKALMLQPSYLLNKSYIAAWAELLNLTPLLKSVLPRSAWMAASAQGYDE